MAVITYYFGIWIFGQVFEILIERILGGTFSFENLIKLLVKYFQLNLLLNNVFTTNTIIFPLALIFGSELVHTFIKGYGGIDNSINYKKAMLFEDILDRAPTMIVNFNPQHFKLFKFSMLLALIKMIGGYFIEFIFLIVTVLAYFFISKNHIFYNEILIISLFTYSIYSFAYYTLIKGSILLFSNKFDVKIKDYYMNNYFQHMIINTSNLLFITLILQELGHDINRLIIIIPCVLFMIFIWVPFMSGRKKSLNQKMLYLKNKIHFLSCLKEELLINKETIITDKSVVIKEMGEEVMVVFRNNPEISAYVEKENIEKALINDIENEKNNLEKMSYLGKIRPQKEKLINLKFIRNLILPLFYMMKLNHYSFHVLNSNSLEQQSLLINNWYKENKELIDENKNSKSWLLSTVWLVSSSLFALIAKYLFQNYNEILNLIFNT